MLRKNNKPITRKKKVFWSLFLALLVLSACEETFIPDVASTEPDIVIEGYIEAGEFSRPPYVFVTYAQPFFSSFSTEDFDGIFVHDAKVEVSNGEETFLLDEICYNELSLIQQEFLEEQLGLEVDSLSVNLCVYLDLSFQLAGEVGKRYDLRVEADGKVLTSTTTIPEHVPLDDLFFVKPPGNPPDTLRDLRCLVSDPAEQTNYYRYFTQMNDEAVIAPINSVIDDLFFNGASFEVPLPKAEPRGTAIDPVIYGLYPVGNKVTIKWCNLDLDHYNFWNTLEFNAINEGPFSSYTRIDSNIEGGLGIWGGYSVSFYELIVE